MSSSPRPNMEFQALHQAHRNRCKNTDASMCRHSLSFHLHHTLRTELFASFLYLLEQIPLGGHGNPTPGTLPSQVPFSVLETIQLHGGK
eukprot:XP_014024217.1 PREDICTED: alpha N-terminal protein methyltransferase 1B-like [Salmo salar]